MTNPPFTDMRYGAWYKEAGGLCNEGRERQLGPEHDDTLWTLNELARFYRGQRRPREAGALFGHVEARTADYFRACAACRDHA